MPKPLPEMIELLIFNGKTPSGRNFATIMDDFVQRIPNIHATTKKEFYLAYFLGGLYNFQYTQLKKDLGVTSSYWKFDSSTDTLDLIFEIHLKNSQVSWVFRSITLLNEEGSPYAGKYLTNTPCKDLSFQDMSITEIHYKDYATHKEGVRVEENFFLGNSGQQPSGLSLDEPRLISLGFDNIKEEHFIRTIDEHNIAVFSSEEEQVKEAIRSYLNGNKRLLERAYGKFFTKIEYAIKMEAFAHGFLYGSLTLNFKNRYSLDCYVERVAGTGYSDILMISRANGRRTNSVPILIEIKMAPHSAENAMTQSEEKGYFQHVLSLRTYNKKAIIAGIEFNSESPNQGAPGASSVAVREVDVPNKNNVVEEILKNVFDSEIDQSTKITNIRENFMYLCYSRLGRSEFRYLFSLLTGYLISFTDVKDIQNVKKVVFLPTDSRLNYQYALLAIDFEEQGVKKTLVFELRRVDTGPLTRSKTEIDSQAKARATALEFLYSERKSHPSEIHKISVQIDTGKTGIDFFKEIHLEIINLQSFNTVMTANQLSGEFRELGTLTFQDFSSENSENLEPRMKETLFPLRCLFQGYLKREQKEFVFQAIMQGIVSGITETGYELRAFVETNYSTIGRLDLLATLARFDAQKKILMEENLFLFEFKMITSANALKKSAESALQQAKRYTTNLKSLTDEKKVRVSGWAMNNQAGSEREFLQEESAIVDIEHLSSDEAMSSPERLLRNGKRRLDYTNLAKRRRCRRSVESCSADYTPEHEALLNEDLILELVEARKKGHVILMADSHAIWLSLAKVENPLGKILILDPSTTRLEVIFQMISLARESETPGAWLEKLKKMFPKEGVTLVQGVTQLSDRIDFIDFTQLQGMFANDQLVLAKINTLPESTHEVDTFRQCLRIGEERISAIYLGGYEYRMLVWEDTGRQTFKDHMLSLLSVNEVADLYRRPSFDSQAVTLYRGPSSYLQEKWTLPRLPSISSFSSGISEGLLLLEEADKWSTVVETSSGLNREWIPILETAQVGEAGKEHMHFMHFDTQEIRIIVFEGSVSTKFREYINTFYPKISRLPKIDAPELSNNPAENAESIDGLNAAFAVQALLDLVKQKDRDQLQSQREGPLATAIQIHSYLNLAQIAHSTLVDVSKVMDLVKTLLRNNLNLESKSLSMSGLGLAQWAIEGPAVLLNAASVVLDVVELSEARTEVERTTLSTQLAFDVGALSFTAAGMGAASLGASSAATIMGGGTVILAGLGIGITALVQSFSQVAENAKAVGIYFFYLDDAYKQGGYQKQSSDQNNQSIMVPLYGAVTNEINFLNDTIHYGTPYLYSTHHGKTGSGKIDYFFWAGDIPMIVHDKNQALNIRSRLGYPEQATLGNWKTVSTWILPYTPIVYIGSYNWNLLPGALTRHDRGFSVLRKLEEQKDFDYDFYVFPGEYIIDSIREERISTSITIILDEQERTLIVPNFSEKDKEIYQHLHYQIEGPTRGRCSIVLNRMGSLTVNNQYTHYTWVFLARDFSGDDFQSTSTGIKVTDTIFVHLTSPHSQNYYIVDNNTVVFTFDLNSKKLVPIEADLQLFQGNSSDLKSYLREKTTNTTVLVRDFPLEDEHGIAYNGTAFYLSKEDRYLYTQGLSENINKESHLVGCIANACYFSCFPNLFWRSHSQTYQLERKYIFYSDVLISPRNSWGNYSNQIESTLLQADGTAKIVQTFKNKQGRTVRRIQYHLVQDKLVLFAIADDFLASRSHMNTSYRLSFFYGKPDMKQRKVYHQLPGKITVAEIDPFVMITSLSQNVTSTSVLIQKKDNNHYQLIDLRISGKPLLFLCALLKPDGEEVFYFFSPNQQESPAQLFRQYKSENSSPATPLNLAIKGAFCQKRMLFILTTEDIIKELNVLGETTIVAFTTEWTQKHNSTWWEEIPDLLAKENPSENKYISVYGIKDQANKALGVWYDPGQRSYILIQPPIKAAGEQVHVAYLGRVTDVDFFYCDNGILYQQASCSDSISHYFNETQLQKNIPELIPLANSLQAAYFYQQRLWIHQKGLIFSFVPQLPKMWFLESMEPVWFSTKLQEYYLFHNETAFSQTVFSQYLKSTLAAEYETDFSRVNETLTLIHLSNRTDPFVTAHKHALIPAEPNGEVKMWWWNLYENIFFVNPWNENIADWIYLGMCSPKRLQTQNSACFFSPKARMIYFKPSYEAYRENFIYRRIPAEVALSYGTVFLLVLRAPTDANLFIPLLRDREILSLYVSGTDPYTFEIPSTVKKYYKAVFIHHFRNQTLVNNTLSRGQHPPSLVSHYQSSYVGHEKSVIKTTNRQQEILQREGLLSNIPSYVFGTLGSLGIVAGFLLTHRFLRQRNLRPGVRAEVGAIVMTVMGKSLTGGTQAQEITTETGIVPFNDDGFFRPEDCRQVVSSRGPLVLCQNEQEMLMSWSQANKLQSGYYVVNPENSPINGLKRIEVFYNTDNQTSSFYLYRQNNCTQPLDLQKLNPVPLEEVYPYLPREEQERRRPELLMQRFYRDTRQLIVQMVGGEVLLHTRVGDVFQALGLKPDWLRRDDIHLLNRYVMATRLGGTSSLVAVLLEAALLSLPIEKAYNQLLPVGSFQHGKQMARFGIDMLQFGVNEFMVLLSLPPKILAYLFPNYPAIQQVSYSLQLAIHLYVVENDPISCYLTVFLFVLLHLPVLAERFFGIPVTKGMAKLNDIVPSMMNEDPNRVSASQAELARADDRVEQGIKQLDNVLSLFKRPAENKEERAPKTEKRCA